MTLYACLKWVGHPTEPDDERLAGMSPADESALEFALRQGERLGVGVTAVTVGPAGADRVLRDALACGAARAVRIDAPLTTAGVDVGLAIADHLGDAQWVWCGDHSLDRGAGSVPAFIAAQLGAQQALGVVSVDFVGEGVHAVRRLDGGRREVLGVRPPAVVSVEGATAPLRRASLAALRAARTTEVDVRQPGTPIHLMEFMVRPYRPRARAMSAPAGDTALERLAVLTDAAAASAARGETVRLDPEAAAERIVRALREWGHLPEA